MLRRAFRFHSLRFSQSYLCLPASVPLYQRSYATYTLKNSALHQSVAIPKHSPTGPIANIVPMAGSKKKNPMPKRLIICCDGTWQSSDNGKADVPTNVTRITRALEEYDEEKRIPQIVYYQSGVGTGGMINRLIGGGTGFGLSENVREAYGFLAHNYQPGDTIHLFGFSRGAYTARSIAGLICRIGVLTKMGMDNFHVVYKNYQDGVYQKHPGEVKALQASQGGSLIYPGVTIETIGCWDTVGSLGIPPIGIPGIGNKIQNFDDKAFGFHDTKLSDGIKNAFHALALNENRGPFKPALWWKKETATTNLSQCWFPGVHTNIGGGYEDQEIADMTLAWMIEKTKGSLKFSDEYLNLIVHNDEHTCDEWARGKIYNSAEGVMWFVSGNHRTPGEYKEEKQDTKETDMKTGEKMITEEKMHISVRVRKKFEPGWPCIPLNGWTWNNKKRLWEKGTEKIPEDVLGEFEKKLAGPAVIKDMLGDTAPTCH